MAHQQLATIPFNAGIAQFETANTWDDMITLGASASDGDVVSFINVPWAWDATAGIWVPQWAHGNTILESMTIDGDEANDAALTTKGWTVTKVGAGTVAYDGTRVKFQSSGSNSDKASVEYIHSGTQTNRYFCYGRVYIENVIGANDSGNGVVYFANGSRWQFFNFRRGPSYDYPAWIYGGIQGDCDSAISFNGSDNERFFLLTFHDPGNDNLIISTAWIEGSLASAPACLYGGSSNSSALKLWFVGDTSNLSSSDLYVRDLVIARY